MIKYCMINTKDVDDKLRQHLWRCSYKNDGHLFSDFEYTRQSFVKKHNYIVYATYNNKFAGWGLRFQMANHAPVIIMLHVYKKYRRNGIGREIVNKLTKKQKLTKFIYFKDRNNTKFFNKLEKETE